MLFSLCKGILPPLNRKVIHIVIFPNNVNKYLSYYKLTYDEREKSWTLLNCTRFIISWKNKNETPNLNAMLIVPWIIWWIFRNQESTARLFFAGLLVMVLSEILDAVGVSFGKWSYPVKVIPVATIKFPFRLSVLPVFVMLLLQFKPSFNPYIKAIFFGGLSAYVGMPMMAMNEFV
ncbi:CBO0543 family protein [Neobacillus sp. NPDC093182]|uniref:CBO0543 family protein n=1 Tax=Neobacillus sp. NPDC093182 TaxID=3364297 RepID=UPI003816F813